MRKLVLCGFLAIALLLAIPGCPMVGKADKLSEFNRGLILYGGEAPIGNINSGYIYEMEYIVKNGNGIDDVIREVRICVAPEDDYVISTISPEYIEGYDGYLAQCEGQIDDEGNAIIPKSYSDWENSLPRVHFWEEPTNGWAQLPEKYYDWVTIEPSEFTLQMGEYKIVKVTIVKPDGLGPLGEKARCELLVVGWPVVGTTVDEFGEEVNIVGNAPIAVASEWYIESY
jgi:hypothetical protein